MAAFGDGADQACASLDPGRVDFALEIPCGSRIRRDFLDGGFCQGIVSDGPSPTSVACSASADFNRMTSILVHNNARDRSVDLWSRNSRCPSRRALAIRCASRDLTMMSSMSAAGTRETDPSRRGLGLAMQGQRGVIAIADAGLGGVGRDHR